MAHLADVEGVVFDATEVVALLPHANEAFRLVLSGGAIVQIPASGRTQAQTVREKLVKLLSEMKGEITHY